jgi:two-component system, sensor histidine kinase PdtaS
MLKLFRIIFILWTAGFSPLGLSGKTYTRNLDSLIQANPSLVFNEFYAKVSQPNAQLNDYLFLNKACIYLGKYYLVDSLLDHVFTHYSFEGDSLTYIDFLGIEYESKKVLEMYEESLVCLNKILEYTQRKGKTNDLAEVYLKYTEYYRAATNFDMALLYLDKINNLNLLSKLGISPYLRARAMNRKAAVFHEKKIHFDSVEWLSKKVIHTLKEHHSLNLVASSCNELGFLYLNDDRVIAEFYFKRAINIWEKLGYENSLNSARLNLARYYLRAHKPEKAIPLALMCVKITRDNGWPWDLGYWNEVLSIAYEQQGNYKKALHYLNIAKDGLLNISTTQYKERLAYYSSKLELKKSEEELFKKNVEVERVRSEMIGKAKENRNLIYFTAVLLIGLFGTLLFLWLTIRQKRMVKQQKEEIGNINLKLEELLGQKEILIKEVNHRVKNNLSILAGLMYLKEKELKNSAVGSALKDMQGRINTISLIHETLYQRDDVQHINFQEYLERLSSQIMDLYPEEEKVRVIIECGNFKPELSLAMPLSMMMNELMTNSLKYAFRNSSNGKICIQYDPALQTLIYFDSGPGYVFSVSSTSLGLKLLHILATQIGADLNSIEENGMMKIQIKMNNQTP